MLLPAQPPFRINDRLSPQWRQDTLQSIAEWTATLPAVRGLGDYFIASVAIEHGGTVPQAELAQRILTWVHNTYDYHDDPPGEEWYQGPFWTMQFGGDCEDLAVVLVALMIASGIDAQVVWQDQPGQALNHVTAQVLIREGGMNTWQWADPTVKGARLNEEPHMAAQRLNQLEKLGITPGLVL